MKILFIPNNTENNCFGVRNKLPGDYLEKLGHEVRYQQEFKTYNHDEYGKVLDPTDIDWCDVVVFNRHYEIGNETLRNIFLYAKNNGKRVVYDTDDLLDGLDMSNPSYQGIKGCVSQVRMMASLADVCTTTGEFLKEELLRYNDNVEILPNCIEVDKWKLRKGKNRKVKVGWAGGSSHIADLLLVVDVVAELQRDLDFEFVIFGLSNVEWNEHIKRITARYAEESIDNNSAPAVWYSKTLELNEKLKRVKFKHVPFVSLDEYNAKLSQLNLDIGICPLEDTRFNRCKSPIKFYEYAMVGTTTIASRVSPYREEVSLLAKNKHYAWHSKLYELITNNELREKEGKEQRNWVLENRDIIKNIGKWLKCYKKIC